MHVYDMVCQGQRRRAITQWPLLPRRAGSDVAMLAMDGDGGKYGRGEDEKLGEDLPPA